MALQQTVKIVDTSLRDGEQSAGLAFSVADKIRLAQMMDRAGIDQIEAGIPAIGGLEIEALQEIVAQRQNALISTWNRLNPSDIQKAMRIRTDIIHIGAPVSYAQLYVKLRRNKQWLINELRMCVTLAKENGYAVTVGFEDASRADICFLVTLGQLLADLGVQMVRYADTVGVLHPTKAQEDIHLLKQETGLDIEIHTHNDIGLAVANAVAAAKGGAIAVDCTVLGIGERSGNCNLRHFLKASKPLFQSKISVESVAELEQEVGLLLPQTKRSS